MATEKNFNGTTPAAPSGARLGTWQVAGSPSGTDPTTGQPYYDASLYMVDMVGDTGSGGADGLVPAPPAGSAAAFKFLKADGTWQPVAGTVPQTCGFYINNGQVAAAAAYALASRTATTITKCSVLTIASDPSTALTFKIKQNGTDIFSSDPSVSAGTSTGTVSSFTTLNTSPLPVTQNDVFLIDITSGTSNWEFIAQLE